MATSTVPKFVQEARKKAGLPAVPSKKGNGDAAPTVSLRVSPAVARLAEERGVKLPEEQLPEKPRIIKTRLRVSPAVARLAEERGVKLPEEQLPEPVKKPVDERIKQYYQTGEYRPYGEESRIIKARPSASIERQVEVYSVWQKTGISELEREKPKVDLTDAVAVAAFNKKAKAFEDKQTKRKKEIDKQIVERQAEADKRADKQQYIADTYFEKKTVFPTDVIPGTTSVPTVVLEQRPGKAVAVALALDTAELEQMDKDYMRKWYDLRKQGVDLIEGGPKIQTVDLSTDVTKVADFIDTDITKENVKAAEQALQESNVRIQKVLQADTTYDVMSGVPTYEAVKKKSDEAIVEKVTGKIQDYEAKEWGKTAKEVGKWAIVAATLGVATPLVAGAKIPVISKIAKVATSKWGGRVLKGIYGTSVGIRGVREYKEKDFWGMAQLGAEVGGIAMGLQIAKGLQTPKIETTIKDIKTTAYKPKDVDVMGKEYKVQKVIGTGKQEIKVQSTVDKILGKEKIYTFDVGTKGFKVADTYKIGKVDIRPLKLEVIKGDKITVTDISKLKGLKGTGEYGGKITDIGSDIKLLEMQTKVKGADYLTKALTVGGVDKSLTYAFTGERPSTALWPSNIIAGWEDITPSTITRDVTVVEAEAPEGTWKQYWTIGRGKGAIGWPRPVSMKEITIKDLVFTAPKTPKDIQPIDKKIEDFSWLRDKIDTSIGKPDKIDTSIGKPRPSGRQVTVQKPIVDFDVIPVEPVAKQVVKRIKKLRGTGVYIGVGQLPRTQKIIKTRQLSITEQKRLTVPDVIQQQIQFGKQKPIVDVDYVQTPIPDIEQDIVQIKIPKLKIPQITTTRVPGITIPELVPTPIVPPPIVPPGIGRLPRAGILGRVAKPGVREWLITNPLENLPEKFFERLDENIDFQFTKPSGGYITSGGGGFGGGVIRTTSGFGGGSLGQSMPQTIIMETGGQGRGFDKQINQMTGRQRAEGAVGRLMTHGKNNQQLGKMFGGGGWKGKKLKGLI